MHSPERFRATRRIRHLTRRPEMSPGPQEEHHMGLHDEVTNRILAQIESGTPPWVKPWATPMPYNAATSRRYRGVNVLLLWDTPYERPAWITFQQARMLGGHVRQGERATQIVYVSDAPKKASEGDDPDAKAKRFWFLTRYSVFNVAQVEGLPRHLYAPPAPVDIDRDAFFSAIGADVRHGGPHAFYNRLHDFIQLPHPEHFETLPLYHATRLHETVHWTGHSSRLDRDFGKQFGDQAYAFEELVAEIGAAFLSADLGLTPELHHAAYIDHWVKILRDHRQAIFSAAARATRAREFLVELCDRAVAEECSARQ
jgi:antirestriction protein ArdC